jgi:CubicO group peptidase (beta-lactamase class C family)
MCCSSALPLRGGPVRHRFRGRSLREHPGRHVQPALPGGLGLDLWWVNSANGENYHFSARGKYGQYIYVAPEKDLVIVRLGKEEGEKGYDYWIELFEQLATKLDTSVKGSR